MLRNVATSTQDLQIVRIIASAVFKRLDVIDLKYSSLAAFPAPPRIAIEYARPQPPPATARQFQPVKTAHKFNVFNDRV